MVLKKRQIFAFLTCLGCVNITTAAVLTNRTVEHTTFEPVSSSDANKNTSVCWTDNVAYNNEDIVPGAGPCEQCVCKAPSIVCSMIKCDVKTGCKIIQKANQCCPDYKCDCEYNGQPYDNGAKIDTPDTPCRVCYCKGGDIMCTTVGCYEREDCGGKIVPGTCCPKYDHCPPLDPDNPKNRIKLTTANAVTLRNGKRGSQPWLLTTDSGHTVDALSELTTAVNEDSDYVTETNSSPDKMITMILKRFNNNDSTTWYSMTTLPPSVNDTAALRTLGTNDFNASANPQTLPGADAAKEAINTVKVQSPTTTLSRTTSSLDGIVEARTELGPSSSLEEDDFSSDNSSEESKETSRPMFEIDGSGSRNDTSEESKETDAGKALKTSTESVDGISSTSFAAGLTEAINVEYSTPTRLNFSLDEVAVAGNDTRNTSAPVVSNRLVEGTTLTIQTTVIQVGSGAPNISDDTESAQVLFVEKGSNLSHILSGGRVMDAEIGRITSNSTSTNAKENETSATSSSGESTSESTGFQIGLHKNLSLFVDASKFDPTDFLADMSTATEVEATTVDEVEDGPDSSTISPTTSSNNDTENSNQNTSTSTTDTSCVTLNVSDAEIFAKPINNLTHENETAWAEFVTDIETISTNPSENRSAVEGRESVPNMTEAFAFTYTQLGSAENLTYSTECAPQMVTNSSTLYGGSNLSTSTKFAPFDNTSSLNPVTMAESTIPSTSSPPSANSSESLSILKTTSPETTADVTHIQNATVTAASTQPPISVPTVVTQSSTETGVPKDFPSTITASKVTQSHANTSATFTPSSTATPIAAITAQTYASNTTTPLTSGPNNSNTTAFQILDTTAPLYTPNTTLVLNGTSVEKDSHVQLMSQKYVLEPVKLISSVNSVYMSPGLGYRETLGNHSKNSTVTVPPKISAHENTSQVENSKTNSPVRSNSSVSAYKILLDGKVKPLTRPPNTTIAPLSWLKRPALSKNSTATVATKSTAANNTASTASKSVTSTASTTRNKTVVTTTPKSTSTASSARNNATTATVRSIPTVSHVDGGKITNSSTSATTESTPGTNSTREVNATVPESSSLKNESRQEPAQAKVYDPLMPYPEEYPEEYQTIQNGPAIIITRTTYTRIPDVTYTTVTMATLPTYARVQKAEENFASTLFDRKFGERSYERSDGEFGHGDGGSPASQSYFNIDVKKVDEKADEATMAKNKRKVIHDSLGLGESTSEEGEDVHTLDEKDMKIVENFMNKNLKL